jgi:hypothetical protein
VALATLLSHDKERIDACYDGEQLWYRTMEDLLGDQPVLGLVPHDMEAQLHLACDDGEPRSFAEAERDAAWHATMKTEMDAVEKNHTWELADLPRGHRAITLKWVFKLKRDEAGVVIKHKARLMARGFVQQEGVDFDDAFAPVAQMESVRLLLALAAQEGWRHMDVKSVFLNNDLKEEVYVHQPPGFAIPARRARCYACARPSTACGRHRGLGMPSWIPHSRGWASSKARTRPSTGGVVEETPCWWASTSTTW